MFELHGVESEIATLPYASGCDYLISNTCGTCGIQRKDSVKELIIQMEELRYDILPRLIDFTDNPVLLVEESHIIGDDGYLFRRDGSVYLETGMHSKSYYGFLETVRMMGVDVVCTRNLDASIWYMIAMDGYLSNEHYPKHLKSFKPHQSALGMLACIPKVGMKRATKALESKSLIEMYRSVKVDGLTDTMLKKLKQTMESKL